MATSPACFLLLRHATRIVAVIAATDNPASLGKLVIPDLSDTGLDAPPTAATVEEAFQRMIGRAAPRDWLDFWSTDRTCRRGSSLKISCEGATLHQCVPALRRRPTKIEPVRNSLFDLHRGHHPVVSAICYSCPRLATAPVSAPTVPVSESARQRPVKSCDCFAGSLSCTLGAIDRRTATPGAPHAC